MDSVIQGVEPAVLRRMTFATFFVPKDVPHYWNIVANFANQACSGKSVVTPESARMAMENLQVLSMKAFSSDEHLAKEIIASEYCVTKQTLGVPLVPKQCVCRLCGGKLLVHSDRPSRMTLYTESLGTVPATHFHKYCNNHRRGCKFIQFYGYHKSGDGGAHYSEDWMELPYFLSSQETGFEMALLKQFDVELLIGQLSYKQKASIYNACKGYDTMKKECSTTVKEKKDRQPPVHGLVVIS